MTKASNNPYPSLLLVETDPDAINNPAAGRQRLILDPADHALKRKDSAGSLVGVGGISVPPGGTTGQWLKKLSGTDYDADWDDAPSGGGADLTAFRLASVADDPGTQALGSLGDEMEYADATALAAVWTARGGTPPGVRPTGSSVEMLNLNNPGGLFKSTSGIASSFEIGMLVSNVTLSNSIMPGIALVNSSGVGIAMSPYSDGNSYLWEIGGGSGYGYQGTGPSGGLGSYTAFNDGRPVWFYVRYNGAGHWRLRYSESGASPTTLIASASRSAVGGLAQVGWNHSNNPGGFMTNFLHRVVYATPDLGL